MKKAPEKAFVLAAGKGTRMKSDLPKVLVPVLGRPMIEYVLDALRAMWVGGSTYSPSMVFDVAENLVRGIKRVWDADESAEMVSGVFRILDGLATAFGVPFAGGASQVARVALGPEMEGRRAKRRAIIDRAIQGTLGLPSDLGAAKREAWQEIQAQGLMEAFGEDGTPRSLEAQRRAFDAAWDAAVKRSKN